jgi:1,2-phenylacetyl-CoA epoxidase PaaB subunit
VLFYAPAVPVNIIQEAGGRKDRFGTIKSASNAAFAIYSARKDVFPRRKMVFSRQIWIIAKAAVYALMSAGRGL